MKEKTTEGLGDKNVLSFVREWLTELNIGDCMRSNSHQYGKMARCQQSYVIQYVNQSESLYLDNFSICWEANGVSKESTCADNMKL
jgi:hypothetical protein